MRGLLPILIFAALVLGVALGLLTEPKEGPWPVASGGGLDAALSALGDIFFRLISMAIVPIILTALIYSMAGVGDVRRLGKLGGVTLACYLVTTTIAVLLGLALANGARPGRMISQETRAEIARRFDERARGTVQEGTPRTREAGFWPFVKRLVPYNITGAMTEGKYGNMLQLMTFAILFGIATTLLPREKQKAIVDFTGAVLDALVLLIRLVLWFAPVGVFCLIAVAVRETGVGMLSALAAYALTVVAGLGCLYLLMYPAMALLAGVSPLKFVRGMLPAQITAFSTSSSSATLSVNMECAERLGVRREVTSFVLPLGSQVNMDGTALYQTVATVFIAQVTGVDLTVGDQAQIVLLAILASIGAAGVPGAGLIMILMILSQFPAFTEEKMVLGIALVLSVDRILDMCRTVCNVTSDAACALLVNRWVAPRHADPPAALGV